MLEQFCKGIDEMDIKKCAGETTAYNKKGDNNE